MVQIKRRGVVCLADFSSPSHQGYEKVVDTLYSFIGKFMSGVLTPHLSYVGQIQRTKTARVLGGNMKQGHINAF